jgi:hypothetical protein
MTGTTVGGMTAGQCPICRGFNTAIIEFGIAHCEVCNFFWHYFASREVIAEEVRDFIESKKKTGGYPKRFEGIFKSHH